MTITIDLPMELYERLREKAAREGQETAVVVASVLTEALAQEARDHEEAVEGIRRGLADFDSGRFRPLEEVATEKKIRYGLPD